MFGDRERGRESERVFFLQVGCILWFGLIIIILFGSTSAKCKGCMHGTNVPVRKTKNVEKKGKKENVDHGVVQERTCVGVFY